MAQFARPASDVLVGTYTTEAGGTTNLYQSIDEDVASPNDSDFVRSVFNPGGPTYTAGLSSVTDPVSSSGHIMRWRRGKSPSADSTRIDTTVQLLVGIAVIATVNATDIPQAFTTVTYTLSGAEADSITDYTVLRLSFQATQVSV